MPEPAHCPQQRWQDDQNRALNLQMTSTQKAISTPSAWDSERRAD